MGSLLFQMEKLDESNYEAWQLQMKSMLVHSEIWDPVENVLDPQAKEEVKAKFLNDDKKAVAMIILGVKSSQLIHIKNLKTAKEIWDKLKSIYQQSSPARKVSLFKKLLSVKLSEKIHMSEYINEFVTTNEKLKEIGVEIDDEILVILLLSGLSEQYENFVVAMETRDTLPSFEDLKIKLLEQGERHEEKRNETHDTQQAFAARNKNNKQSYDSKDSKRNSGKRDKRNSKCFNCGKRGHYARECKREKKSHDEKSSFASNILAATSENTLRSSSWCVDSGATSHMCCMRSMFSSFVKLRERILLADNNYIEAQGKGNVIIKIRNKRNLELQNVLYVPEMSTNFISVSRCVENGLSVKFCDKYATIAKGDYEVLRAQRKYNLFIFEIEEHKVFQLRDNGLQLWHNRFGHLNYRSLKEMINKELIRGINIKGGLEETNCNSCAKAKICSQAFPEGGNRSNGVLDLIHMDVCGPMNKQSIGGSRYFVTFIDDFSRRIFVYFLKIKSEVFEKFKVFHAMAERQTGRKIKVIRSDNGREFVNAEFNKYLEQFGIKRQLSVPYTPQQNGVAERANRTLVEMARTMMVHSGVAEFLWAEAVCTAAYIRNRSTTKALKNKTPFECWSGKKPTVSHFKIFGCKAVALDKTQSNKFIAKGKDCIFVGYSLYSKAYRLYDPEAKRIFEARDVKFDETSFRREVVEDDVFVVNPQQTTEEANDDQLVSQEEDVSHNEAEEELSADDADAENESQQIGPGRPRLIRTGRPGRPRKVKNVLNIMKSDEINIPSSSEEAMNSKEKQFWMEAMEKEFAALLKNKTWSLTQLPKGQRAIGCKWVYNLKRDVNGNVERFKARLVAKGCSQQHGVNYTDTFSPVVRYSTVRMLFALSAQLKLHVHQLDVTTAYLNSELHDVVYMQQPEHFVDVRHPKKVLRLNKAIYGLKQSGREWHSKLDGVLKNLGYKPCVGEPCLYSKNGQGKYNFITIYVDDLLIASTNEEDVMKIKQELGAIFEIVDKGIVRHILGIEVERNGAQGAISLSQKRYIEELLLKHGMKTCRPVSTPLDPGFQVGCTSESCKKVDATTYQSLIGELMYLAVLTRPDILHAVCKLSQRNQNPHQEHMAAVNHILRYLSGTKDVKIHYERVEGDICIEGFVDADWGSDNENRKSYSGYVFLMAGGVFSYESKKQNTVALSSTEAEYVALSSAAKEVLYLNQLLKEIDINVKDVVLYCDNVSAQHIAKNEMYHARTKHIDIKHHFIRDVINKDQLKLDYINTNDNIADLFTKNLVKSKHEKFVKLMNMRK